MEINRKPAKKSVILKIKAQNKEVLVNEIQESCIENRPFNGIVKEIVEFNTTSKRVLLMDCAGGLIYCLLLDYWAVKLKAMQKGCKVVLGPSKVLKVPLSLKSFYAPNNGKLVSDFYFHFEGNECQITVNDSLSPLNESDLLGYTESVANFTAGILDVWIEKSEKSLIKILNVIDYSVTTPIKVKVLYDFAEVFHIGHILLVYGAHFIIHNNEPCIKLTQDSSVTVFNPLSFNLPPKGFEILEHLKSLQNTFSVYSNFPEIGKFTYVIVDHWNNYFLVLHYKIQEQWIKITKGKVSGNHVFIDEDSYVCGFPQWMNPVNQIIELHHERLKIVVQETKKSTCYFDQILLK